MSATITVDKELDEAIVELTRTCAKLLVSDHVPNKAKAHCRRILKIIKNAALAQ